ncbi:glycosyltransferase family 2 protein [Neptunicoccus sediminis]|uniref:glycosyltransferase family 2 protein n=1 Tax=Neptunicoccus sediminis TaxID=1892596 RepID=UPI000845D05C|nr:glycosyltransferase family 2 protein [Neptunicoccus sediminis]
MSVSFIITSYNIDPYIEKCLNSVAESARAGDEIIVVDDGSRDRTVDMVRSFMDRADLPEGVDLVPVFLGANTFGGVGIAANIGLDHASRDTVFLVDGDDWLNPASFNTCRAVFEQRGVDFLLVNYLEYDELLDEIRPPSDQGRWQLLDAGFTPQQRRDFALSMIAVPWRKFYRRDFLKGHNLRFPEGDFFFEDNPFHWAVCRAASNFSFFDQVICYHRVNRPGQTMASTGAELMAFFTHYDLITADLPADDPALKVAAMRWLVNNMSWHLTRLRSAVLQAYGQAAATRIRAFDESLWNDHILTGFSQSPMIDALLSLRAGDLAGFVSGVKLDNLQRQLETLHYQMLEQAETGADTRAQIDRLRAVQEFDALTRRS